jgi:hypothetical protein
MIYYINKRGGEKNGNQKETREKNSEKNSKENNQEKVARNIFKFIRKGGIFLRPFVFMRKTSNADNYRISAWYA